MLLEHGKSFISVDDDIIFITAHGAFNLEGATRIIAELKYLIENFHQKEFKLLLDYSEIEGGTPEVFDKINDCNIWLNSQAMVAKAIIIKSETQLKILESRAPARKLQNYKNFVDKTSAIQWLKSQ
jgi:hypothetical protein